LVVSLVLLSLGDDLLESFDQLVLCLLGIRELLVKVLCEGCWGTSVEAGERSYTENARHLLDPFNDPVHLLPPFSLQPPRLGVVSRGFTLLLDVVEVDAVLTLLFGWSGGFGCLWWVVGTTGVPGR
jgi:hypothetical protein